MNNALPVNQYVDFQVYCFQESNNINFKDIQVIDDNYNDIIQIYDENDEDEQNIIKNQSEKSKENKDIIDLESQSQDEEKESQDIILKNIDDQENEDSDKKIILSNDMVNIRILTNQNWPLKQQKASEQAILPYYLQTCYQEYSDKYLKEFQQRKLELLHHCSYSSLIFRSDSKKQFQGQYTIQVSSYSMIILLRFNNKIQFTFNQLYQQTRLKKNIIIEKLKLLVKSKILSIQNDSEMEVENEIEQNTEHNKLYKLNTQFESTQEQIDLDWIPNDQVYSNKMLSNIRNNQQSLKTQSQYTSQATEERKPILQSVIAKIMKEKETLAQDELIKQVIQKLNKLFVPTDSSVKEQIKFLTKQPYELLKYSDKEDEKDIILYIK